MQQAPITQPPPHAVDLGPRWPRPKIGTGASAGVSMSAVQAALKARRRRLEAAARGARG